MPFPFDPPVLILVVLLPRPLKDLWPVLLGAFLSPDLDFAITFYNSNIHHCLDSTDLHDCLNPFVSIRNSRCHYSSKSMPAHVKGELLINSSIFRNCFKVSIYLLFYSFRFFKFTEGEFFHINYYLNRKIQVYVIN